MSIFKFVEAKDNSFGINQVIIDFKELVNRQFIINNKFPNPNRESKFINVFDNMIGQLNEEVYETNIELEKNKKNGYFQSMESLEEFIDAFMYSASLFCETATYFNIETDSWLADNKLANLIIYDPYNNNHYQAYRGINHEIIKDNFYLDYTSVLRREIYDRKYHKPVPKKPTNYKYNFLKKIIYYSYMPPVGLSGIPYNPALVDYYLPIYVNNFYKYFVNTFFCYDAGYNTVINTEMINNRINNLNMIIDKKENYIANL